MIEQHISYIPISEIKKTKEPTILKPLSQNDDIVNNIVNNIEGSLNIQSYIDPSNCNSSIDECWLKLGIETCNVKVWSGICYDMLHCSFGTAHRISRVFSQYHLFLDVIKYTLGGIIRSYYPVSQHYVIVPEALTKKYLNISNYSTNDTINKRLITGIFYNSSTIDGKLYQSKDYNKENIQYKNTITSNDKETLMVFKNRCEEYHECLQIISIQIIKNSSIPLRNQNIVHKLIKELGKLKKRTDALEIIKDIHVKERCTHTIK